MKNTLLTELPVNPQHVEALASVGITTIEDVLEIDTSPVGSIPQDWFKALKVLAELVTVKGVGPATAGHLYWAGIRSVGDLAECVPEAVCAAIRDRCANLSIKTALQNEKRCVSLVAKAKVAAQEMYFAIG